MNKRETKHSGGIGCLTVIGIIFIVLKCLSIEPVASWSWLWVLCPFWIPIIMVVGFGIGFILIVLLLKFFRK